MHFVPKFLHWKPIGIGHETVNTLILNAFLDWAHSTILCIYTNSLCMGGADNICPLCEQIIVVMPCMESSLSTFTRYSVRVVLTSEMAIFFNHLFWL